MTRLGPLNPTGYPWRVITVCVRTQVDAQNHTTKESAYEHATAAMLTAKNGQTDLTEARILHWDKADSLWRLHATVTTETLDA
jgi:hypothetical protein